MSRTRMSVIRSLASVLAVLPVPTTTAVASNTREYDRGCADAKIGSYDRSARPGKCLVSSSGVVAEVMFAGCEGRL